MNSSANEMAILHKEAVLARLNSYSPYSTKKVGAALSLSNGKIFSGTNIENVSFGGTVCAERVAIWKALSENPGEKITEIVVVTDEKVPWSPCGFCRQVLAEFASPALTVHLGDLSGIRVSMDFQNDLFPAGFTPESF
jgi:cytidine deaminase